MRGRDFVSGVVIGAVVGATLGLLLAPQSGAETRDALRSRAQDLGDKVKESSRQVYESGRDMLEKGKTQVATTIRERADRLGHARTGNGETSEA